MLKYAYIAKSSPYGTVESEIDAETEEDAINKLAQLGYFPVSIEPKISHSDKERAFYFKRISGKDVALVTRQLSTLADSTVNIIKSLNIVSSQMPNKYLKAALGDVANRIKDGESLSGALEAYPDIFPGLYTSMVRSGEAGGKLDFVLAKLADFLEKEEEFKNSLRSSLAYPAFVFAVGILTIVTLMGFVIPNLVGMFEGLGQTLPLPTRVLIAASSFLRSYWWVIVAIIFLSLFLAQRILQKPEGRMFWDRFKLKLPLFGQVVLNTEISRLMATLSLLLSSGLSIVESLGISASVVTNQALKSEIKKFEEDIITGSSLSDSFKKSKLFPGIVINIISIGEETGSLDKSLLKASNDYEREVDRTLKGLARMLEPVIILIVGVVVGFIVLSMLLPIFQINLIVK